MAHEYTSMYVKKLQNNVKAWLSRYEIRQDGKEQETMILNWRTALAHARKYRFNLFDDKLHKVEILNLYTGEIVDIDEAERRANAYRARR